MTELPNRVVYIKLNVRLTIGQHEKIKELAQEKGIQYNILLRELLSLALTKKAEVEARYDAMYQQMLEEKDIQIKEHRREIDLIKNEIALVLPSGKNVFSCQACGKETLLKKRHIVPVCHEEYYFCENCFFSGRYKPVVIQMIQA